MVVIGSGIHSNHLGVRDVHTVELTVSFILSMGLMNENLTAVLYIPLVGYFLCPVLLHNRG